MSYLFKQLCLCQYWKAIERFPFLYYNISKKYFVNRVHKMRESFSDPKQRNLSLLHRIFGNSVTKLYQFQEIDVYYMF